MKPIRRILLCLSMCFLCNRAVAADWSITELQLQYGRLDAPSFAGGNTATTTILTFQHASAWKYGDNFLFIDYLSDKREDGFNDQDFYGELYLNFSLGKILDRSVGFGAMKDISLVAGLNVGADTNIRKYLPGIRLSWSVPGFSFLNTAFTAYLDDSGGISSGGAPSQDDSYHIDVSWLYPFSLGEHDFTITGHVEYIGERENELGGKVSSWVLAQPQFRYDLGKTLFNAPNKIFVGVEWQWWNNKLGDSQTDENAVQALFVWRL